MAKLKKDLIKEAEDMGIEGANDMLKDELEEAIRAERFAGIRFREPRVDPDKVVKTVEKLGSNKAAAEALDLNVGDVAWHVAYAIEEAIESDDPEELAALIAQARDEDKTPWMPLSGRARMTRGQAQKLYQLHTDRDPAESNIGLGGRGKGGQYLTKEDGGGGGSRKATETEEEETTTKPKATKSKKAKSKAKGKTKKASKAKANGLPDDWEATSEDDITTLLTGKTVTTSKGEVEVKDVVRFGKTKSGKRVIQVETPDGDKDNIVLATVTAVA